jgi:hypothetical protein
MGTIWMPGKGEDYMLDTWGIMMASASTAAVTNASVCSRRHQQQFEPYNWTELRIMEQTLCSVQRNK